MYNKRSPMAFCLLLLSYKKRKKSCPSAKLVNRKWSSTVVGRVSALNHCGIVKSSCSPTSLQNSQMFSIEKINYNSDRKMTRTDFKCSFLWHLLTALKYAVMHHGCCSTGATQSVSGVHIHIHMFLGQFPYKQPVELASIQCTSFWCSKMYQTIESV